MDVILIKPGLVEETERDLQNKIRGTITLPHGLLSLGAILQKKGYEVLIIDETLGRDTYNLLTQALSTNPICVGITATTGSQLKLGVKMAIARIQQPWKLSQPVEHAEPIVLIDICFVATKWNMTVLYLPPPLLVLLHAITGEITGFTNQTEAAVMRMDQKAVALLLILKDLQAWESILFKTALQVVIPRVVGTLDSIG